MEWLHDLLQSMVNVAPGLQPRPTPRAVNSRTLWKRQRRAGR